MIKIFFIFSLFCIEKLIVAAPICASGEKSFTYPLITHVSDCTALTFNSNPPSGGTHYEDWAQYKTYMTHVPHGFWVHSLEHGAVVITYHCPNGCGEEIDAIQTLIDKQPIDPLCTSPVKHRLILTPDTLLDVKFAASAWGYTLRADCFDSTVFSQFINQHYAKAPENLCGGGLDLSPNWCSTGITSKHSTISNKNPLSKLVESSKENAAGLEYFDPRHPDDAKAVNGQQIPSSSQSQNR